MLLEYNSQGFLLRYFVVTFLSCSKLKTVVFCDGIVDCNLHIINTQESEIRSHSPVNLLSVSDLFSTLQHWFVIAQPKTVCISFNSGFQQHTICLFNIN